MRLKAAIQFGISVALLLLLPRSSQADTIFTYTGNSYGCGGVTCKISITFDTTLAGATLDNLAPGTNISGTLVSFTMTDGDQPPPHDTGGFAAADFSLTAPSGATTLPARVVDIGTDAAGNITSWDISQAFFASYPAVSGENPTDFYCEYNVSSTQGTDGTSVTTDHNAGLCPSGGSLANDHGTWSPTFQGPPPTVPEPASCMLLGSGLIGAVSAVRRKRKAART